MDELHREVARLRREKLALSAELSASEQREHKLKGLNAELTSTVRQLGAEADEARKAARSAMAKLHSTSSVTDPGELSAAARLSVLQSEVERLRARLKVRYNASGRCRGLCVRGLQP